MDARVAQRYGEALFSLARDRGKIPAWKEQVREVRQVFLDNPGLGRIFSQVRIAKAEKRELLRKAFGSFDPEVLHFLELLSDKGRIGQIDGIARYFNSACDEAQGIAEGTVYSPYPLGKEELAKIEKSVGERLGRQAELSQRIDESLILGVRVEIGNHIFDGSAKGKIEKLRDTLMEGR